MSFSPLIRQLIDALRILPGVGQKTAQRMALQLLERDRSGGRRLAEVLASAMDNVGHCRLCRTLSEDDLCPQCADPRRDDALLCVVQSRWMSLPSSRPAIVVVTSCSRVTFHRSMVSAPRRSAFLNCSPGLRRGVQRGDSGDQSHRRGRGNSPLHRAAPRPREAGRQPDRSWRALGGRTRSRRRRHPGSRAGRTQAGCAVNRLHAIHVDHQALTL